MQQPWRLKGKSEATFETIQKSIFVISFLTAGLASFHEQRMSLSRYARKFANVQVISGGGEEWRGLFEINPSHASEVAHR